MARRHLTRALYYCGLVALAMRASAGQNAVQAGSPASGPLVRYADSTGDYAQWWDATLRCARLAPPFPFDSIQVFVVQTTPQAGLGFSSAGFVVAGRAYPPTPRIVLGSPWVRDGTVVRHEMLHLIVGAEHDPEYFQRRCAGVVTCVGTCRTDTTAARP